MKVRRLGGGYGAKLTRSTWVAALCAVAAKLSNRPVRTVLDLQTNMRVMGKRYPCYTTYEVPFIMFNVVKFSLIIILNFSLCNIFLVIYLSQVLSSLNYKCVLSSN